jgi:hypothetical protein
MPKIAAGPKDRKVRHRKHPGEITRATRKQKLALQTKAEMPWWDLMPAEFDREKSGSLEVIAGRSLKPVWIRFFEMWSSGEYRTQADIRAAMAGEGMEVSTDGMAHWPSTDWFKALRDHFFSDANVRLAKALIDRDKDVVEMFGEVAKGEYKEPRMASAAMAGLRSRMEMKLPGGPLIDRSPRVEVNNTINNIGQVNMEALKGASQAELLRIRETGVIPEHLKLPG